MRQLKWAPVCALLATSAPVCAQSAPPGTDIYLAPLSMRAGRPVVGTPVNITNRRGYDNQPSFTPDSRSILFTSVRDDAQADIYRYDLATKTVSRVTATPESEYSATVMPGRERFSAIRVERDSTQRLWSFNLDGSDPRVLLETIKPVGYHAWVDDSVLALFILGARGVPSALVRANARSGRADTLARDIGQSLVPLVGRRGFSYVQRTPDSSWVLKTARVSQRESSAAVEVVATLPSGADYVAWLSTDMVLSASGGKVLVYATKSKSWAEVADLSAAGLTRISRLAVSPDGRWLALVAAE